MKRLKVLVLGLAVTLLAVAACVPAIASPGEAKAKQTTGSKLDSVKPCIVKIFAADQLFDVPAQSYQVTLYRSNYRQPVAKIENVLLLPYNLIFKRSNPPNLFYERNWLSKQHS